MGTESESGLSAGDAARAFLVLLLGEGARRLVGRVWDALLPSKSEGDASLGRLIVEWKKGNVVNLVLRAEAKTRGRAVKAVRLDFLLPLLESAGYVEDNTLQDLFAELLAAAATGSEEAQHPLYRDALVRMSPEDAAEFRRACELMHKHDTRPEGQRLRPDHATWHMKPEQERHIAHLVLLNLVSGSRVGVIVGDEVFETAQPSPFGREFAQLVMPGVIAREQPRR